MADTRTIYLVTDDGHVFTGDPAETEYNYVLMTDFTNLNPTDTTKYSNDVIIYGDYDVTIMLTFNDRNERATWVSAYQKSITQLSVAVDNNKNTVYSKVAKIKSADFIENPYINGVQLELTLTLSGKWMSSPSSLSTQIGKLTGGNKKYRQITGSKYGYKYKYQYGALPVTDEFITTGFNGFILSIPPQSSPVTLTITSDGGTVSLKTSQTNVPLQISSDMVGYGIDDFDKFTLLKTGFSATQYWDNFLEVYGTLKKVLAYEQLTVTSINSLSQPVSVNFYEYNVKDFI